MVSYEELFEKINIGFEIHTDEGRELGIYEAQDFLDVNAAVERRHAARIFHNILLKKCGVKDLEDIEKAGELLDLYDCRVCVNHIAQVYLRGIMDERLECIFDGRAVISDEETKSAIDKVNEILKTEL